MINDTGTHNGWAVVGQKLIQGLRERHDVTVLSRKNDNFQPEHAVVEDGWFVNPFKRDRNLKEIVAHLGERSFDAIVCGIEPMLPLSSVLQKHYQTRQHLMIGQGTHVYFPFMKMPHRLFYRSAAKTLTRIVVPSKFTESKVMQWYKGKVSVVPWGVDCALYTPDDTVKKNNTFLFVGEQKERKGVGALIKAFKKVHVQYPEVTLKLLGRTNDAYVKEVAKLQLEDAVYFAGAVNHSDLLQAYRSSHCHVLPSVNTLQSFEGFGLVHLEANACGIPSIGSTETANEEVIEPGVSGYLCDPFNIDDIANKMMMVYGPIAHEKSFASSARKHAQKFSWNTSISLFEKLLTDES